MRTTHNRRADTLRVILFLLLLPILLLLAGPVLVLAGMIGRLKLPGGLTLTPGRRAAWGRLSAIGVGAVLWLLVWGAVGQLALPRIFLAPAQTNAGQVAMVTLTPTPPGQTVAQSQPATIQPAIEPTDPVAASATPLPPSPTTAPTNPPATSTSTTLPTATSTTVLPTNTPVSTPTRLPATLTPTPVPVKPAARAIFTETAASTTPITTAAVTTGAFAPADNVERLALQQTIDVGNELLLTALRNPTTANLAALETVWQGEALTSVQTFVNIINGRYQPDMAVRYLFLNNPVLQTSIDGTQAVAQTQEAWDFAGRNAGNTAYNLYNYRLQRQENGLWQIVSYQFETLDDAGFQRTVTTAFSATATALAVPLTP